MSDFSTRKQALAIAKRIANMSNRWPPSPEKRKAVSQWAAILVADLSLKRGR